MKNKKDISISLDYIDIIRPMDLTKPNDRERYFKRILKAVKLYNKENSND